MAQRRSIRIPGSKSLTIDDYGTTTFNAEVGVSDPLAFLTIDNTAAGQTVINMDKIDTSITSGTQSYGNPVTLDSSTTLTGNGITFQSTAPVNSENGTQSLTIDDYGTTTFNAQVGT